ncbi:MAG: NAD(P)/FAD-dependent oxidoreductase [Dehalococcoidia bacterium]|nr:NAD(P)/FAD-dependent oxidoreductase [Dehalococcoidia bacterium]
MTGSYDALVVGAGPNGLSAAIAIAQTGHSVLVVEGRDTVGGGARSAELTLPGFLHDVCSAIHPLAVGSPFFPTLPLSEHGLEWVHSPSPLAHPLDDGTAVTMEDSVDETAEGLGPDASSYRKLFGPLVRNWDKLSSDVIGPLRFPRHPLVTARFGLLGLRSAVSVAQSHFEGERARALFAGIAAHSVLPLERPVSAAVGLVLGASGHAVGWPMPRGGAQRIADALASHLTSLGGRIETGVTVDRLEDVPDANVTLLDVTPRQVVSIAGDSLPDRFRRKLEAYRYGPAAFKVDWALDGPVPWTAPECARAGTVHLGGTMAEVAQSEREVWNGRHPEQPFVLLAQPSIFDSSRAPEGKHTAWAYCHVPNGSDFDMTDRIEDQIERFAPGFRERILARSVRPPAALEEYNPNLVGGDIGGGVQDLGQLFSRPVSMFDPYSIPSTEIFICSSSTPPGGGVHGMCGYFAAQAALRRLDR